MAPTIVGTDEVTSLSRRIIVPYITDWVYPSNALLYRLNAGNRKSYQGGTHIEVPVIYQQPTNGGAYDGAYDQVNVDPWETTINMAFEVKYYQVPLTIDERTIDRMNTPLAVANELTKKAEEAKRHLADLLGTDLSRSEGSSDAVAANQKKLTGMAAILDDGSATTTYGGLTRATYDPLDANVDSTTATLTFASLNSMVGDCTKGAHSTTLIRSRREQYNRFHALCQSMQRIMVGEAGSDEALASAGFRNILFDNIPWIVDDKVADGANSSNSDIEFLNEEYLELAVLAGGEFEMTDWRMPVDQPSAMTSFCKWKGEIYTSAPQMHGVMSAVVA